MTETFYTGKSCVRGHTTDRYISSGRCVECVKEANKKWYLASSEKAREWVNEYRKANPNKIRERKRVYREANSEKIGDAIRKWRSKNRALVCVHSAKKRCMKTGMDFTLDREWVKQNYRGYCALTGIPFITDGTRSPYAVSLDRIDNQKGYLKNNCRFVLFGINTFKGSGTDNDMYSIAEQLLKSRKGFKP